MSELSPEERALLETVRAEWGPKSTPPPPSGAAIRAHRAAKPWLDGPFEGPRAEGIRRALGTGIAAIGVCAVGFVALHGATSASTPAAGEQAVGVVEQASKRPSSDPAASPEVDDVPLGSSPTLSASVTIDSLPDSPPIAPTATTNLRSDPRPTTSAARRLANPPSKRTAETDPTQRTNGPDHTLGEELVLIRAAHRDLRTGSPGRALESLASHASRFPHGILRDERMTLQVLALCALGETAAARDAQAEPEQSSPGSSHLHVLGTSCAR